MTGKQLKVIFGILAALVAAWAAVELAGGTGGSDESPGPGLDIGAAVDGSVRVVRVLPGEGAEGRGDASDSVRLELRDGEATVNGFPADSAQVRGLVAALDSARANELVARNPANHDRLGVGEGARRVAVGEPGSPVAEFLLGDAGRGGRFVRATGAAETYLLTGPAATLLARRADDWKRREIAAVDTAAVRRIELRRKGRTTVLVRGDAAWTLADGSSAADRPVSDLLSALADLRASGSFPSDSLLASVDFDAPDALLRAFGKEAPGEGAEPLLALRFVQPEEGEWLLRRADAPHVYPLPSWRLDRLFPPTEELAGG